MRNIVRTYIEKQQLLSGDGPVLVGLSGGADSVALLALLVQLDYPCVALHCNFHLRGDESVRDEQFAREMARTLDVPFYKIDFDTAAYGAEHHLSIEMAARELRYNWFEEMRLRLGAQAIAVAHHRDDSVETVLMNLVRGTGIRGLGGIRPKNGYVVRPLLAVSRSEILDWLAEQQLSYVTDSTNLSDAYTRNFIRLRVLPLLEELNPSVKAAIARTADHLAETEAIYLYVVEKARRELLKEDFRIPIARLMEYPSPATILYELLKPYGFTRQVADDVFRSLTGESGKMFYSPDYRLLKDREYLLLSPVKKEEEREYTFTVDDIVEEVWRGPVELSFFKSVITTDFCFRKDKHIAYFDYDKLSFPLTLRKWKEGDWFIPFGMKGRKKLSDYFSDHKFSRMDKEQTWLLCSGENILWIVGERSDNRFCIDKTTKSVLVVNFFSTKIIE
ncbi:tRNA lysidine(34) synthetase TilS [uncultured Parabacteroides sp.]|uniref:tRNA lysidine(34) synthetase TilS n=1 Tax=uncultured Parabacteroides sp. TaxID=512312 RepID=UPI0025925FA9|nr:tRNA lysidine(34) synthetase TilS [uncultured Parabacteroides sp.]